MTDWVSYNSVEAKLAVAQELRWLAMLADHRIASNLGNPPRDEDAKVGKAFLLNRAESYGLDAVQDSLDRENVSE